MCKQKIGFIGLGNMGGPMCRNIMKGGYQVTVFDVKPEILSAFVKDGAKLASSIVELASENEIVITMLPSHREVQDVVFGNDSLINGMRTGSTLIEMSTSSPTLTKKIGLELAKHGVSVIDSPVSKGIPAAKDGTLTLMIGGEAGTIDKCRGVLMTMAKEILHVGGNGAGHAMKLVNQIIAHTELVSICEAFMLGVKFGLDEKVIADVISKSSGNSFIFQYKHQKILNRDFKPGSTVDILYKDLYLAGELGADLAVPLNLTNLARDVYQAARAVGLSKSDGTSIITLYEKYLDREIGLLKHS